MPNRFLHWPHPSTIHTFPFAPSLELPLIPRPPALSLHPIYTLSSLPYPYLVSVFFSPLPIPAFFCSLCTQFSFILSLDYYYFFFPPYSFLRPLPLMPPPPFTNSWNQQFLPYVLRHIISLLINTIFQLSYIIIYLFFNLVSVILFSTLYAASCSIF